MARFSLAPFTKGLNTFVDPAAGDLQSSPDLKDVRGHTGILTLRKGFKVLDIEPSSNSTRGFLAFDGTGDYATHATWPQTLGTKWTLRWEVEWAVAGNATDGTRTMLLTGSTTVSRRQIGVTTVGVTAASTVALRVVANDKNERGVTLTSTARTVAAWASAYPGNAHRYVRLERNGDTLNLYVGEVLEATGSFSGFGNPTEAEVASSLTLGGVGSEATMKVYGSLVIVNRLLTEAECYWGIAWPTDNSIEADILGNWIFNETTGATVTDYSPSKLDLTITNAAWTVGNNAAARGLGLFSWRRSNGDIYHSIACGRRAASGAGAAPSGIVYSWKPGSAFTPYYFGGTSAAGASTAGLSGLDPFSPVSFVQGRDTLILSNGTDYCRKYQSAYKYLGGTAPPTAPVLGVTGTGLTGTFLYAYSYYNSTEGTETGLSPTASVTPANQSVTVLFFDSSDTQFNKVRIYRSQTAEPTLYLLTEVALGSGAYTDAKTDANLVRGPLCPGGDVPGNRNKKRAYLGYPNYGEAPNIYRALGRTSSTPNRNYPAHSVKGPGNAPGIGESGSGSVNAGTHYWAYSYYDSVNDVETGMSPATAHTAAGSKQIDVTALVLPPEGTRFDKMRLYRTKAAGVVWFLAQTFTAATTATETQADSALTATIETRALPPVFAGMTVFANRLWGFSGPTLFWSTAGQFEDHPEANGFAPKAGVDITATNATNGALFVHFKDGTVHLLPHPGDEPDLGYFVPLNLKQWSPVGAAIGHFTAQAVPEGIIWLAKDGFYLADPSSLTRLSPTLSSTFLNLNAARGAFACSLYNPATRVYRCWVSRGNNRLNEECFVYYLDNQSWWLDSLHADAAGVLLDAQGVPHYCTLMENAVLNELDETLDYDGDGTGTLSGTVAGVGMNHFTEIGSYTAPLGGDGGYPVWFVKSDGTMVQRFRVDDQIASSAVTFYPSYVSLTSGTWTAYYHGIRGYIKTMLLHLGTMRDMKNIQKIFFLNRVKSAGTLQVNLATDEGTLTAVNQTVDLTKPVSQVTTQAGSGRVFQLEIYSSPPAASRPWGLKAVELEGTVDTSDAGT